MRPCNVPGSARVQGRRIEVRLISTLCVSESSPRLASCRVVAWSFPRFFELLPSYKRRNAACRNKTNPKLQRALLPSCEMRHRVQQPREATANSRRVQLPADENINPQRRTFWTTHPKALDSLNDTYITVIHNPSGSTCVTSSGCQRHTLWGGGA